VITANTGTEHEHQVALFQWFTIEPKLAKYRVWSDAENKWLFPACAVPNGFRGGAEAGRWMLAEGMQPGFPDVFVSIPAKYTVEYFGPGRILEHEREWHHGLLIEMKAPNRKAKTTRGNGGVEPNQREWLKLLTDLGYKCVVCWSIDEAKAAVLDYLGLS
jgi:hypothetical protein